MSKPFDAAALDTLYRRYAPVAQRRARRILGNEAEALEVVHDTFASLLERPEQFDGRSDLTTFMYRVITNRCLNRLRDNRTRMRLLEDHQPVVDNMPALSPELAASLRDVLSNMPEMLAAVTVYHHGEGLTQDEIAQIIGCSRRQVGNLLEQAQSWFAKREQRA